VDGPATRPPTRRRRAGLWWRGRARPAWRTARPLVVLAAGVTALVLGVIGFMDYDGADYGFLDALYRSIGLFGLGGAVDPPVPETLEVARVLAPLVTGYAAIRGLIALSREQLELASVRLFARDHVVVAGLGEVGRRLASAFDLAGYRVVIIEQDVTGPHAEGARERGITVLAGSAADPELLRRTAVERARLLFLTCGEDSVNIDAAAAARELAAGRRHGVLTVFAHLDNLELWQALNAEAVATAGRAPVRVEFFNAFATAARLAVDRRPPFADGGGAPREPHVLIVGLESMGEQLVLHLVRAWQASSPAPGERLRLTLAGGHAEEDRATLLERYPDLGRACTLGVRELDLDSAAFRDGDAMVGELGACDVTFAYVCLWSESEAMAAALALHARADAREVPVVVAVSDSTQGVGTALDSDEGRLAGIHSLGVFSEAASPAVLLEGTTELLARAKHEEYVRSELARGVTSERNASLLAWSLLPESLRESNRRFADGIGLKLHATGCAVGPAPLIHGGSDGFAFSADEVEALARDEHERWTGDLIRDGWRPTDGPKDPERKLHPLLVSWQELPEEEREKDRGPIRDLPDILARAGLRIYRA
jgi:TrkA-N domain/RyR domain